MGGISIKFTEGNEYKYNINMKRNKQGKERGNEQHAQMCSLSISGWQMTQIQKFRKMGYVPVFTCQEFDMAKSWSFAQDVTR